MHSSMVCCGTVTPWHVKICIYSLLDCLSRFPILPSIYSLLDVRTCLADQVLPAASSTGPLLANAASTHTISCSIDVKWSNPWQLTQATMDHLAFGIHEHVECILLWCHHGNNPAYSVIHTAGRFCVGFTAEFVKGIYAVIRPQVRFSANTLRVCSIILSCTSASARRYTDSQCFGWNHT